jgi:asparagine synthase (glutamine-hydrolysing)
MCGIFAVFGAPVTVRTEALEAAKRLRHRGPDCTGVYCENNVTIVHERLAIVDLHTTFHPLKLNGIVIGINGEIYNSDELKLKLPAECVYSTKGDCEVLLHMYLQYGPDFVQYIRGMFAFVLWDSNKQMFMVARDVMGIVPLYIGWTKNDIRFASEFKALLPTCDKFDEFPPGTIYCDGLFIQYPIKEPTKIDILQRSLEEAVISHLTNCDVPFGVMLGGLGSSLIAYIASAHLCPLHTFTIGLRDSPDLLESREVSKFLKTLHHEYIFTVQEGIDALPDVIYHVETFDLTTIRACVPLYLLARRIKATGTKMVLSGEGADQLFGNKYEYTNKAMLAFGVETRVPFLDKCFENRIDKWVLRKAFEHLPNLWKEQSNGTWIESLKAYAESNISDIDFSVAQLPTTKEEHLYRSIFVQHFGELAAQTVHKNMLKSVALSKDRLGCN